MEVSQNIHSRPNAFDMSNQIPLIGDVISVQPPAIWLNVQALCILGRIDFDAPFCYSRLNHEAFRAKRYGNLSREYRYLFWIEILNITS
ncbi:uncharacterized protein LOC109831540 isoform X3 [Asparagus officinalis]|uniref:uncharacterized protein LOC109831540 isoform X3 n=1 Tax=Asparagus officinalis TaxID=4686 RepID=UPI00098E630F|nr:uncharacterized protein LOC109831540 isoform X3 [Asparagus officinalis]